MKLRATRWRGWFRSAASADEATLGRKPTDEEEAKWHAASDGERDALTYVAIPRALLLIRLPRVAI